MFCLVCLKTRKSIFLKVNSALHPANGLASNSTSGFMFRQTLFSFNFCLPLAFILNSGVAVVENWGIIICNLASARIATKRGEKFSRRLGYGLEENYELIHYDIYGSCGIIWGSYKIISGDLSYLQPQTVYATASAIVLCVNTSRCYNRPHGYFYCCNDWYFRINIIKSLSKIQIN